MREEKEMRKVLEIGSDVCVLAGAWSVQHAAFLIAPALGFAVVGLLFWLSAWLLDRPPDETGKGGGAG